MNNLMPYFGLGGAPLIEAIIERFKQLGLANPVYIIVLTIIVSFAWNLLLGIYLFGFDLKNVISVTLVTAITTNVYHEATKPQN